MTISIGFRYGKISKTVVDMVTDLITDQILETAEKVI